MKFGLNQKCRLIAFELRTGTKTNFAYIKIGIGDKNVVTTNFNPDRVFVDNKLVFHKEKVEEAQKKNKEYLRSFIEPFVTPDIIDDEVKGKTSYDDYVKALVNCLPANSDEIDLDVFLQYQFTIQKDKDRTWLEVPRNLKQGKFLCKTIYADFKETRSDDEDFALEYDADGEKHPFYRSKWFMESNYASAQGARVAETRAPEPMTPELADTAEDDLPF